MLFNRVLRAGTVVAHPRCSSSPRLLVTESAPRSWLVTLLPNPNPHVTVLRAWSPCG